MYRNRLSLAGAVFAAVGALAVVPGYAHAQASGTLQATAVVLDDAVNRELETRLERMREIDSLPDSATSLPRHPVTIRFTGPRPAISEPQPPIRIDLIYM